MDAVASLGVKNITLACSSLFPVHEHLVQYVKSGVITGIDTDYMYRPMPRLEPLVEKPLVKIFS